MAGGAFEVSKPIRRAPLGSRRSRLPAGLVGLAIIALGLIFLLALGTIAAVQSYAGFGWSISATDWAAVRFTVLQASLSALFSVLLAIPVARALARRQFPGRPIIILLMGAPFILPVIVAVLGLLAVFGRNGLVNLGLVAAGFEPISIYGLHGVVLAHVFFNMPLATRLILQGWQTIPSEHFRLAASLDFTSSNILKHLEWPMLRSVAPKAFVLIFVVCLTSFAVALTLGGGPRSTTIELAIYQAFTFEFDLGRAARLAILQVALGLVAGLIALRLTMPEAFGAGLDRVVPRWDAQTAASRAIDIAVIAFAAAFLILPLVMIALRGLPYLGQLDAPVALATLRSLAVALGSVGIVLILSLPLALWAASGKTWVVDTSAILLVAASPLVMGAGLFILVFPWVDPARVALPATALVNAAAALPFVLRVLVPGVTKAEADFGRLADSLAMPPRVRLRRVVLPRIRTPLAFACGLTAALSMGDLGVITLFAGSDEPTLPLMIFRLMGAYRMDAAAAASLVLLVLSLGLFWAFDKGLRADA